PVESHIVPEPSTTTEAIDTPEAAVEAEVVHVDLADGTSVEAAVVEVVAAPEPAPIADLDVAAEAPVEADVLPVDVAEVPSAEDAIAEGVADVCARW
ncbi:hypothetical protein DYB36_004063, partial [Aphanomyces astaci]